MQARSSGKTEANSYKKLYAKLKITKDTDHTLTPKNLLVRAQLHFKNGYFDLSLIDIAHVLQRDPAFIDAYYLQSQILDSKGDAVEAVKCLLTALVVSDLSTTNRVVMERLKSYSILSIQMALNALPAEDHHFLMKQHGMAALLQVKHNELPADEFNLTNELVIPIAINFC